MTASNSSKQVLHYHEATKHHVQQAAKSLGYMDWANQPNPFRMFKDSPVIQLPFIQSDLVIPHQNLFLHTNTAPQPYSIKLVAAIVELSLALSAWKEVPGSKWSLRINPSSGNLHPTESYWMLPETESVSAGLYHYNSLLHGMVLRSKWLHSDGDTVKEVFGSEGFLVILSSIFVRESWKYGERAYRYCNHDVGHALAALSFAAGIQGWSVTCLNETSDASLFQMAGLDRTQLPDGEQETADIACWLHPNQNKTSIDRLPKSIVESFSQSKMVGEPEPIAQNIQNWPIIKETALACEKPVTESSFTVQPIFKPLDLPPSDFSAVDIIRKRRSAVAFNPHQSTLSKVQFLGMLNATLPRPDAAPFNINLGVPKVHLFIFVHQVTDLAAGFYAYIRNPDDLSELKQKTDNGFLWQPADTDTPLYLLKEGNYRNIASEVSCHQDIAGESAFSLSMLAHFYIELETKPYIYKRLFWECGMIGQVLFLQAEAYGFRGTGIGCFFDDDMHDLCGLVDDSFQSLYHFTVGFPVEDTRISTRPPYFHLTDEKI